MLMPRGIRDIAGAITALVVLGVALVAMNAQLRQGVERFSGNFNDIRSSGPVAALSGAVIDAFGAVRTFGGDNTLMFAFLIAATVLVVLMLRT
jgi:hypothetical protein